MNITFNPGGIIGAILGTAIGVGLAFLIFPDNPARASEIGQKLSWFLIGVLVIGAITGNKLWELLVKRKASGIQKASLTKGHQMPQLVPEVTVADVERMVHRDFPPEVVDRVLSMLESYGTEKWHVDKYRVHLACLKLANGNLQSLQGQISVAKIDLRDVVGVAEYPEVSKIGFVGMEKLTKSDPAALEELYRRDWEQYHAWLGKSDIPKN